MRGEPFAAGLPACNACRARRLTRKPMIDAAEANMALSTKAYRMMSDRAGRVAIGIAIMSIILDFGTWP